MLEEVGPSATTAGSAGQTTAQHQQMAREIQNADFAEEYFASLSAPAKRLIEVSKLAEFLGISFE